MTLGQVLWLKVIYLLVEENNYSEPGCLWNDRHGLVCVATSPGVVLTEV